MPTGTPQKVSTYHEANPRVTRGTQTAEHGRPARPFGGAGPTGSRSMIRFVLNAYLVGIVLFFMLFALQTPNLPVKEAAVSALVWPYGVYKHFVV